MLDLSRKELAINGGRPIRTKKWRDNVTTGKKEKDAVLREMESGYLSLFEGSHHPDEPFSFYGVCNMHKFITNSSTISFS